MAGKGVRVVQTDRAFVLAIKLVAIASVCHAVAGRRAAACICAGSVSSVSGSIHRECGCSSVRRFDAFTLVAGTPVDFLAALVAVRSLQAPHAPRVRAFLAARGAQGQQHSGRHDGSMVNQWGCVPCDTHQTRDGRSIQRDCAHHTQHSEHQQVRVAMGDGAAKFGSRAKSYNYP